MSNRSTPPQTIPPLLPLERDTPVYSPSSYPFFTYQPPMTSSFVGERPSLPRLQDAMPPSPYPSYAYPDVGLVNNSSGGDRHSYRPQNFPRMNTSSSSRSTLRAMRFRTHPPPRNDAARSTNAQPQPRASTTSLAPAAESSTPVDLRALDVISPYDDHLVCPICVCPFVDPVRLQCGHVFCKECVKTALTVQRREHRNCPSCRSREMSGVLFTVDKLIERMLSDLRVKCPQCQHVMTRGDVQYHVDHYCEYTKVSCPDKSCEQKAYRKNLTLGRCLHRKSECEDCGDLIMEQDLESHQEKCQERIIVCPDCDDQVFAKEFKEHQSTCPKAMLPCPASIYGCTSLCKRDDLEAHAASCPLALLGPFLAAQNDRIEAQEAALNHLRHKNEKNEKLIAQLSNPKAESSRPPNPGQAQSGAGWTMSWSGPNNYNVFPPMTADSPFSQPIPPPANPISTDPDIERAIQELQDSVRDEVARLHSAISDVDNKHDLLFANEISRIRQDAAYTNSVLAYYRNQLNWVVNKMQVSQVPRIGSFGASTPPGMAGPSTGTNANPTLNSSLNPNPNSILGSANDITYSSRNVNAESNDFGSGNFNSRRADVVFGRQDTKL